jgi:pimeloyl-ACP methyl ester carboxylesterase
MSIISRLTAVSAATLVSLALAVAAGSPASAVGISPPGANDFACRPSAAHPYPVVLVPGTFESMAKNWATLSPDLKSQGYCVYSLDYGVSNGVPASGPITASAAELRTFVDQVLTASRAKQVDIVGHSQGGMMPRYYMGFLGGARKVHQLIGIAPSNHGTTVAPTPPAGSPLVPNPCAACDDQAAGSPFLTKLNSIGDIVAGPSYTVISTVNDEVVRPYTSQALAGPAKRVTNIVIQNLCPLDPIEHDQTPNDPVVHQLVSNALAQVKGPGDPNFRPTCV